ncbi:unnamed protein product [Linum trigynum]|uniref:Uncharacterized protein n=1 Tax=Linum trigynum TaxID=586398 RepID=A0AAV2DBZ4_9ROSI
MLGKPLWCDKASRLGRRLGYPKVRVEVGLNSQFPASLTLVPDRRSSYFVHLKYCNMPEICTKCSRFGHKCPETEADVVQAETGEAIADIVQAEVDEAVAEEVQTEVVESLDEVGNSLAGPVLEVESRKSVITM